MSPPYEPEVIEDDEVDDCRMPSQESGNKVIAKGEGTERRMQIDKSR